MQTELTATRDLPDAIDISTGLPVDVCGVACFVEAFHADAAGNYSETPAALVRVSATTVVGDRIAIVDVKAEDATAPLSAVMQFALDQLSGPASWPVWGESSPVAFVL